MFFALQIEAEACRAGLLIVIHQGWSDIDLESDCSLVVAALANSTEDCSDIGRVMADCKDYMSEFHSINFRYVFREANGVAHRLAHLASCSFIDNLCLGETSSIIEDVIVIEVHALCSPRIILMSHK